MHRKVQNRYRAGYLRDACRRFATAKNGRVVMDANAVASHREIGKPKEATKATTCRSQVPVFFVARVLLHKEYYAHDSAPKTIP